MLPGREAGLVFMAINDYYVCLALLFAVWNLSTAQTA